MSKVRDTHRSLVHLVFSLETVARRAEDFDIDPGRTVKYPVRKPN